MGETKLFLFMPFLGTHLQVTHRGRIFTHDGSNDEDWRKMCFFGLFYMAPHLGSQTPENLSGA